MIRGLPDDASELRLARMLADYRDLRGQRLARETRTGRARGELIWIGLQQRLLSSIEAFACTLQVHERSLRPILAEGPPPQGRLPDSALGVLAGVGADDEAAGLDETALAAAEEAATEAVTLADARGQGEQWRRAIQAELARVEEMRGVADACRHLPDARVRHLLGWIREQLCLGSRWNERRLLIFTEYEDTRRYLETQLRTAIEGAELAEERIAVFSGPTPADRRETIKEAFNAPPDRHPLRILLATDAAREGINTLRLRPMNGCLSMRAKSGREHSRTEAACQRAWLSRPIRRRPRQRPAA